MKTQSAQVKNIIALLHMATPEEVSNGMHWYFNANKFARELAKKYNVQTFTAAGIIAALSPGIQWDVNKRDANEFFRRYNAKLNMRKEKFSTYYNNVLKAIRIIDTPTATEVAKILVGDRGRGLKTMNFYLNIVNPLDSQSVTVDRHAYKIANGISNGGEIPVGIKQYRQIKQAYIIAGETLQMTPSYIQAITWETYRRIHGVSKNTEENVPF